MITKYRETPEDAGIVGWPPGEWREIESDEDETLLHPSYSTVPLRGLLFRIMDPQMRIERWTGSIWEPASWRHLAPIEQSRRLDRARRYNELQRALKGAELDAEIARANADEARRAEHRAIEEAKAAPARRKAAESQVAPAEAELREVQKQIAALTQPVPA